MENATGFKSKHKTSVKSTKHSLAQKANSTASGLSAGGHRFDSQVSHTKTYKKIVPVIYLAWCSAIKGQHWTHTLIPLKRWKVQRKFCT